MSVKFKVRIFALFQFISFVALLLIVFGVGVSLIHAAKSTSDNAQWWTNVVVGVLTFNKIEISSIFGSVLVYIGIALVVVTWILGWTLFLVRDRNFYDQLFLLFVCIPVFSNLFALFAQLSLNTHKFTNSKLAKEEIELEKTKIIALFNAKKKQLQKELENEDRVVKVEAELDGTPDIKLLAKSEITEGKSEGKAIVVKKAKIVVEPKEPKVAKKEVVKKETAKPVTKKPTPKKTTKK